MGKYNLEQMADAIALDHLIDPTFLKALIDVESDWNTFKVVFDPRYIWVKDVKFLSDWIGCTQETMRMMQQTTYGLMQIVGVNAYTIGYKGWLTQMLDPRTNLEWGCKILQQKQKKFGDDPATLYASYNGGSPRKFESDRFVNQSQVNAFLKSYSSRCASTLDRE